MISDLNGFQLTGAAREGGISWVEIAYDPTKIQRIRSGSEKVTQKVLTLLFFLLLLLTARQHLMNRYRQPERPSPHPDYDFHARQVAAQQAR